MFKSKNIRYNSKTLPAQRVLLRFIHLTDNPRVRSLKLGFESRVCEFSAFTY